MILDELNIALRYEYLDLHAVVAALRRVGRVFMSSSRPQCQTGLTEAADLVTRDDLGGPFRRRWKPRPASSS